MDDRGEKGEKKSGAEAARILNIPYRTLMRWSEGGLINVEGGGYRGKGTLWTELNIREASVIYALRTARLSLQKIRDIMEYLKSLGENPMSSGDFLVVKGEDGEPREIIKFVSTGEAISLLKRTRGQLVLPLWKPGDEYK
ncbi:MAG: MerR family transcriptional regulator [Deltaproteobacteria bacterium]|uniref:MerR family transcriptional regulator n=1 Tax=Candidatus Zymogenus saltonus TaxID=2844893 RepID=A0A9D8PNW6_9DELT|nr:MerR family transcriptional regulator [Candidatus Zymogenus saltonus]